MTEKYLNHREKVYTEVARMKEKTSIRKYQWDCIGLIILAFVAIISSVIGSVHLILSSLAIILGYGCFLAEKITGQKIWLYIGIVAVLLAFIIL